MSTCILRPLSALALSSILFIACSESSNGGSNGSGDAGVRDSGASDVGPTDATTSANDCNPVDGSGCEQGKACVWVRAGAIDGPQCRDVGAAHGFEATCSQTLMDCAGGYMCATDGSSQNPVCYKVCTLSGGHECHGLQGASAAYTCTAIAENSAWGLCIGNGGSCVPYQQNACGANQTCSIVSQNGDLACAPSGTATKGQECGQNNNCAPGAICVGFQGDTSAHCYEPCSPQNGTCSTAGDACRELQGVSFGICQAAPTACDPVQANCPPNQTCSIVSQGGDLACVPSGTATKGQECGQDNNCVSGTICIAFSAQAGPSCYEVCDPQNAHCSAAGDVCLGLQGVSFGVCQTPQSACDPLQDMCPQDQACGLNGANLECQPAGSVQIGGDCSTAACARGGLCIGVRNQQGQTSRMCLAPCDPSAMNACPANQTCRQLQGVAFGACL